jgi:hypothetical protein
LTFVSVLQLDPTITGGVWTAQSEALFNARATRSRHRVAREEHAGHDAKKAMNGRTITKDNIHVALAGRGTTGGRGPGIRLRSAGCTVSRAAQMDRGQIGEEDPSVASVGHSA